MRAGPPRRLAAPVAAVALLAGVLLAGCGGSARLQRQESAALRHTCQSLYERDHGVSAPPIARSYLRTYLATKVHGFAQHSTRDVLRSTCDPLPAPARSKLDFSFLFASSTTTTSVPPP